MHALLTQPQLLARSVTAFVSNGVSHQTPSVFCLQGSFSPKSVHLISSKRHDVFGTRFRERKYTCCGLGQANSVRSLGKPVVSASMQKKESASRPQTDTKGPPLHSSVS